MPKPEALYFDSPRYGLCPPDKPEVFDVYGSLVALLGKKHHITAAITQI
jgi:hypothetical protein